MAQIYKMMSTASPLQVLRQVLLQEASSSSAAMKTTFARRARIPAGSQPTRTFITSSSSSSSSSSSQIAARLSRWQHLSSRIRSPLRRRYNSTQSNSSSSSSSTPTPKVRYQPPPTPPRSLSERMKEMSKKYGWAVVGIYLGLSALDFPFCFLAVRWFGPERIAHLEHVVIDAVKSAVEAVVPSLKELREKNEAEAIANNDSVVEAVEKVKDEVKKDSASIWTQLLLAYGVHKSLFFLRIPITLAITPKVVKTLRGWGWNIGKVGPK